MTPKPETLEEAAGERLTPPARAASTPGYAQHGRDLRDRDLHDTEHGAEQHEHGESIEGREIARVVFVAITAAAVWFHIWEPFARVSVIGLLGIAVGGYPIFKEAWENIRERRMTMELSMTIALVAALLIGQFFTALVITAFVLVAEILEGLTVGRGRKAIRNLLDYLPRETFSPGDVVLVRPGALVPVDGV